MSGGVQEIWEVKQEDFLGGDLLLMYSKGITSGFTLVYERERLILSFSWPLDCRIPLGNL